MCVPFSKHDVNLTNTNDVDKNSKVEFGTLLIAVLKIVDFHTEST